MSNFGQKGLCTVLQRKIDPRAGKNVPIEVQLHRNGRMNMVNTVVKPEHSTMKDAKESQFFDTAQKQHVFAQLLKGCLLEPICGNRIQNK